MTGKEICLIVWIGAAVIATARTLYVQVIKPRMEKRNG